MMNGFLRLSSAAGAGSTASTDNAAGRQLMSFELAGQPGVAQNSEDDAPVSLRGRGFGLRAILFQLKRRPVLLSVCIAVVVAVIDLQAIAASENARSGADKSGGEQVSGRKYGRRILLPAPLGSSPSGLLDAAVNDLRDYLGRMTGTDFVVADEAEGPGIVLQMPVSRGVSAEAVAWLNGKGPEAFVLRGDSNRLLIVANQIEGLSQGIYYYLESLGVRWLLQNESWTIVPRKDDVTFMQEKRIVPSFAVYRGYAGTGGWTSRLARAESSFPGSDIFRSASTVWMRRLRLSEGYNLGKHIGEAFIADQKVTPVLEAHPEYLAKQVDGEPWPLRKPDGSLNTLIKIDAANPDAVGLFCDFAIGRYRSAMEGPGGDRVNVSVDPSDGYFLGMNYATLQRQGVGDGSYSDQVFHVANQCADRLRTEFPRNSVVALAYAAHVDPPSFPLRDNVIVQLAPNAFRRGSRTELLTSDEFVKLWAKKAREIAIYDYWGIPDWTHDQPVLSATYVASQLRNWHANGVRGVQAESTYGSGPAGLTHYVAAHVAADVDTDIAALRDEWFSLAFGPARAPIQRMIERWEDAYRPSSVEFGLMYDDIQEAARLAAGNDEISSHVDDFAAYLHYLRLFAELESAPKESRSELAVGLVHYMACIDDRHMVQTGREADLLARKYQIIKEIFAFPNGSGWQNVARLTHADIEALVREGARKYPVSDIEPRRFTGEFVQLSSEVWREATSNDLWSPTMHVVGSVTAQIEIPKGMSTLTIGISPTTPATVIEARSAAGKLLTVHEVVKEKGATFNDLTELRVPLEPGSYSLTMRPRGGRATGAFAFRVRKGTPFSMTSFLPPKGRSAGVRLYFYVPPGTPKIAFYYPRTAAAGGPLPRVFAPDMTNPVPLDIRDGSRLIIADVPKGADGKVWSVQGLISPDEPVNMLTTPQGFALEAEGVVTPVDSLPRTSDQHPLR